MSLANVTFVLLNPTLENQNFSINQLNLFDSVCLVDGTSRSLLVRQILERIFFPDRTIIELIMGKRTNELTSSIQVRFNVRTERDRTATEHFRKTH